MFNEIGPSQQTEQLAREVIGAAIEVHRVLGPGYGESIYEEAMLVELRKRGIGCERQFPLHVEYKGERVGEYRIDLVVGGDLVVEIKAVEQLSAIHVSQLLGYLEAGAFQLGLLINFKVELLKNGLRRVIWSG